MKTNTNNRILVGFLSALVVFSSVGGGLLIPTAGAATFNDTGSPFKLVRVSNYSQNPGCSTCWNNTSVNAEVDEIVSIRLFMHNIASDTANDVRVVIAPNLDSNRTRVVFNGQLSASNAGTETDSARVNITNGKVDEVRHIDTSVYDNAGNQVSMLGSDDDVLAAPGLNVGDIAPGAGGAGFVVARFELVGDDDNNNGGGDGPEVTTLSEDNVDRDSARLRCEVDPNGESTQVWFQWGEGDSTGDLDEVTSYSTVSSGTTFTRTISGLDEDTEYVFRCRASNSDGTDTGDIEVFRTDGDGGGDEFDVETRDADDIDEDSATLVCRVETGDEDAEVWFEWGEDDDDLDEDTSDVRVNDNSVTTVRRTITGLDENTRYYYRCVGEDDDGNFERGNIESFRTDDEGGSNGDDPRVTTLSATGIDNASATLRCEVDPNGEDTDAWFEWGTSSSNLNRRTSTQDVGSGDDTVNISSRLSGLVANTTYFYRCSADNDEGSDDGSTLIFRTTSPVVNVVTRFIDVFTPREPEPEPEVEALIITLETVGQNANNDRMVDYTVSYDNRTDLTLTNALLRVEMPRELDFVDADPNFDDEDGDDLIFEIGTIRPGEEDSFLIETELRNNVDENDVIRLVARVEYNDDGSARKIVEVIDESTFGEIIGGGGFTANVLEALRNFFTNPLFWIILFILLIFFGVRYLLASRDKRSATLV